MPDFPCGSLKHEVPLEIVHSDQDLPMIMPSRKKEGTGSRLASNLLKVDSNHSV